MSRIEQLNDIEREVRARLANERPKAVYTACGLSSTTLFNVLSGKSLGLITLRKLANYFDMKDGEQ